jgi:hypothetical protein
MECSAKEGRNVREIFKTFLQLSQIPLPNVEEGTGGFFGGGGLRRRSSAYAGTKSRQLQQQPSTPTSTGPNSPRIAGLSMLRGTMSTPSAVSAVRDYDDAVGGGGGGGLSRNKPRSRSLIRRSSKKVKPPVRDGSSGPAGGDCCIA